MAETEGTRQRWRRAQELRAADVHQVHGGLFARILNSNQETARPVLSLLSPPSSCLIRREAGKISVKNPGCIVPDELIHFMTIPCYAIIYRIF